MSPEPDQETSRKPGLLATGSFLLPAASGYLLSVVGNPIENAWGGIAALALAGGGVACQRAVHNANEVDKRRESDARKDAEDVRDQLAALQTQLLKDSSTSVGDLMDDLSRLLTETPATRRAQYKSTHKQIAAELLRVLRPHHNEGRATIYAIATDAEDPNLLGLETITSRGRHDTARDFSPRSSRGQSVIEFVIRGQPRICNDVGDEAELPEGWDGTASNYRAFVSCPIVVNGDAYGMLTYDIPATWEITAQDADLVMIFAAVAGMAFRVLEV